MLDPNSLPNLTDLHPQNQLQEVDLWQLAQQARQARAKFLGHLLQRLLTTIRRELRFQVRPDSAIPDLADLYR